MRLPGVIHISSGFFGIINVSIVRTSCKAKLFNLRSRTEPDLFGSGIVGDSAWFLVDGEAYDAALKSRLRGLRVVVFQHRELLSERLVLVLGSPLK